MQKVILNGSLDSLDRATLEEYAQVKPPPFNQQWALMWQQAQEQIHRALEKIEAKEKEEKEEQRHRKSLELASSAHHIAKWANVIAVLALTVAIVQTFWH